MMMDCHCGIKRKAEEGTDHMCNCATKRKIEQKAPPPIRASVEAHGGGDVEVPERQMARLSQEEIDEVLSRTKHAPYPNLDDREPSPSRSPEDLEELRELYRSMNENYDSSWATFSKFQAWVRTEFAAKGFVEVDESFLADRAKNRAQLEEDWAAMLEEVDISDLIIGEDDDEYVIGEYDEYIIDEDDEYVGEED